MTTHKKLSARILSMALTVAMVTTMLPMTVFATMGDVPIGASSINTVGTIKSFDRLEDRFAKSTGTNAPDHVYSLSVALNTPAEDLNLPDELTAMVARTSTAPTQDEPVKDSGKPSEPAVDETIPDEDTATDDTVSGNQPASPSNAEKNEEIKDEDVPLAPEPEQEKETTVKTETVAVTWKSDKEYKSDVNGKFIYNAVLPEGYILADGVKLPQIYVMVGRQARTATSAITVTVNGSTSSADGATLEAAITASRVAATDVISLEITAGEVTTADWQYLKKLTALETFEIDSAVTLVADISSGTNDEPTFPNGMVTVIVPQAVTIGAYAFKGCRELTTVSLPAATSIGTAAFAFCTSLSSLSLPKATSFGDSAFNSCRALATLKLPATPPTVATFETFYGCLATRALGYVDADGDALRGNALTTAQAAYKAVAGLDGTTSDNLWYAWTIKSAAAITITITGTEYEGATLQDAIETSEVAVADVTTLRITAGTVTADDWNYLKSLTALQTFEIDSDVTEVANMLNGSSSTPIFPTSIVTVTVPQASTIGGNVFNGCTALTTASFPDVTSIGEYAFRSCNYLTSVSFPKATNIGVGAFASCNRLVSISLPAATSIGNNAFSVCTALATLKLPATPPSVGSGAFGNCADPRALGYVAANGDALSGSTLTAAQAAYKADENGGGTTDDNLWYGWTIGASVTTPDYTGTQAAAPSSTPASKTATSVTLAAVTVAGKTIEYAVSTSATAPTTDWQDGTAFTGLTADTQYYFFARVKATTAHKAGTASAGTAIKTDKTDAQKVAAAKILANAEIGNLVATNRTTAASILSTVNTAITSVDGVTATWKSGSPTITAATDSAAGSITGTIVLTCGTTTVEVTVNKTIAQIGSDAEKVESAKTAAVSALGDYTATNATAASDIMTLVDAAITDAGITGITSSWNVAFSKTNATTSEDGSVTGTITLTLNDVTTDIAINLTIAQLADKATLTATITTANTVKSGITVSDNATSSVASGTRFVTTAEMKSLTDAITAAQAVANNPTSTAVQVSAAVTELNNAVTTFNVAIKTGTYSGGSSGGGGGGGSSSGGSTPAPAPKPTENVTGESKANATVDNKGNATVNVTDKNISDAVKAAQDAATKKGVNAGEVTAVINVTSPANSNPNTVSVNLPKNVQEQIISNKIGNVAIVIDKPDISIGMTLATITEMNKQAKSDIQLSATRTDATKLSTEAKNAIGSRPAFDLKATYASGSKSVTNFGTGTVSIAIPYTLQKGEIAGGLYAVYVDGNGKVSYITNSSYDAENKVLRFSTNHFSVYGISYKAPVGFTDITTHWAKSDIEFVANRGLMNGTSNTTFAPNGSMTRGMFVTALGRLAGVDANSYKTAKFTDVKADTYYAPYVNWAAEKGIVKGTTDTTFAPDQAITRQEMATIMSSYAKALGYQVPETRAAVTFADNASIASWAAPAVKQMQMAGILNGKDGNKFDPTGTATRGEISAMLRRYVELVIDRTTTEGWTTNDSGSSLYYQSGKAVTGTKTISNVAYTFNGYGETTRKTATAGATTNPALPADGKKYITYTVQKGDSFWRIANKVGCTIAELEQLNGKSRNDIIYAGQVLKVPQK